MTTSGMPASPQVKPKVEGGTVAIAIAAIGCLWALLIAFFDWTLIDWFPGLGFLPLHLAVGLVPFVICCLWAIGHLFFIRRRGLKAAVPALLCAATVVALQTVPFTELWLKANFRWHRQAREQVVRDVESGALKPNVSHNARLIALGPERPNVSAGGNEIIVQGEAPAAYVLFFTFRGVINHFSGFLYVPPGGDPMRFEDIDVERRKEVIRYDANWYFVAR